MSYPNTKELDDSIGSKSKPLHSINIWFDNIDNEINDPHPTILVTNINIEHYYLQFDFVIQSHNGSNRKSIFKKDENFTKSFYSIIMEEFEYYNLFRKLNVKQRLIFDDVVHQKNCTLVH
jgi:hypothetical protein